MWGLILNSYSYIFSFYLSVTSSCQSTNIVTEQFDKFSQTAHHDPYQETEVYTSSKDPSYSFPVTNLYILPNKDI